MNALNNKKRKRPHQVGVAIPDDPTQLIKQPQAAEQGICPKVPFRLLCSGASGSGKSNCARWILDRYYNGVWDRIIMLSPTAGLDPMWKDLKGMRKRDIHERPKASVLKNLLDKKERDVKRLGKGRAPHTLLILDDCIAESKFMNSPTFLRLFVRGRHANISTIVLTQSYVKVPRSSRIQCSHVVFFPSLSTEIERLYAEYGTHHLSKNAFFALVKEATEPNESETHPFLYIDRYAPIDKRYRRNLDMALNIDAFASRYGRGDSVQSLKEHRKKNKKKKTNKNEDNFGIDGVVEVN